MLSHAHKPPIRFPAPPPIHRFERFLPLLRRFTRECGGKPWAEQLRQAEPGLFQWASPLRWVLTLCGTCRLSILLAVQCS